MSSESHRLKKHADYGFLQLDPIPGADALSEFYESQYYDLIRRGGRAPDLQRLQRNDAAADRERDWLRHCLWGDIVAVSSQFTDGKRLFEVGCGLGDFLRFARDEGYEVAGCEPSISAAECGQADGIAIEAASLQGYLDRHEQQVLGSFDVVVMLNVLEHIPDPVSAVQACYRLLRSGGILCIKVPNDFNVLQQTACELHGLPQWWIAVPDHINYFNFETLGNLLHGEGFEVAESLTGFPMEMFLLMGDVYVGDPETGGECHRRRVNFEMNMPREARWAFNRALATSGMGRECFVFARKVATP